MTNILSFDLHKAAEFRRTILESNRFDNAASYGTKLCERLAAANTNDLDAVSAYERLQQNSAEKLQRATWGVMSSIGYGFTPSTPDDVLRAVVERVRAF